MKQRADLKTCPVKKDITSPNTGRIIRVEQCGAIMHHYDDHSECPRCGFFIKKDQVYDPKTRETSNVRKLK